MTKRDRFEERKSEEYLRLRPPAALDRDHTKLDSQEKTGRFRNILQDALEIGQQRGIP